MSEVRLIYSEKLIQSWENSLRSAFSPPYVKLSRRPSKAVGGFTITINPGGRSFQTADAEYAQDVIEIRRDVPPSTYWVGFKANFDLWRPGQHILEHLSLILCQQLPTSNLIPIFRAEWDSRAANDSSSRHGQPHWHFIIDVDEYQTFLWPERRSFMSGEEPIKFGGDMTAALSGQFSGLLDFSSFHFAMSPLWSPASPSCHRQVFQSADELNAWFSKLSSYIADQLIYISRRMGELPRTVREFNP